MSKTKSFRERLADGDVIVVAEGYLLELEQRCYLKAGHYVPEVVLDNPEVLRMLHREFVHAGSDVVEAFTYYGHRSKVTITRGEDEVEKLNRNALRIARQVADETGTLMAGNICNTNIFNPDDAAVKEEISAMFKEQVEWAVEEKADYIIGETYFFLEEAMLALETIKKYGKGLAAVMTMSVTTPKLQTYDGVPIWEAMRRLEEAGAAVVGINCFRGPTTMLPLIPEIRRACKGPIACLPIPYRTNETYPRLLDLKDQQTGEDSFPANMNPWHCSRWDIQDFTRKAVDAGVQYMGLCCGNQAHYTRTMAETLGRLPPGSKYSPDMSQHYSKIKNEKYDLEQKLYAKMQEKSD